MTTQRTKLIKLSKALKERNLVSTLWETARVLSDKVKENDDEKFWRLYLQTVDQLIKITKGTGESSDVLDKELEEWLSQK